MNSVPSSARRVEAGIDYLTCTAERLRDGDALLSLGRDIIKQEVGSGGSERPFYYRGFSGYTAGSVSVGSSRDRSLVRISGSAARECAAELIECSHNVSRLDAQVTIESDGLGIDHVRGLYDSGAGIRAGRGRPIERTLIVNSSGGSSFYLGRRISESYGRIYNKSAEDKRKDNPPHWRYEVEFKGRTAKKEAWSYASASEKDSWCVGTVYDWFERRHCTPPISKVDRLDMCSDSRGSTTQSKRIEWLRRCVRPILARLALEYGWPDVLSLLGVPMRVSDTYINEVLAPGE